MQILLKQNVNLKFPFLLLYSTTGMEWGKNELKQLFHYDVKKNRLCSLPFKFLKQRKFIAPVSYTHLDVYKRQRDNTVRAPIYKCTAVLLPEKFYKSCTGDTFGQTYSVYGCLLYTSRCV